RNLTCPIPANPHINANPPDTPSAVSCAKLFYRADRFELRESEADAGKQAVAGAGLGFLLDIADAGSKPASLFDEDDHGRAGLDGRLVQDLRRLIGARRDYDLCRANDANGYRNWGIGRAPRPGLTRLQGRTQDFLRRGHHRLLAVFIDGLPRSEERRVGKEVCAPSVW